MWLDFSAEKGSGTLELESATGKNSACEGFGQKFVRTEALTRSLNIRNSILSPKRLLGFYSNSSLNFSELQTETTGESDTTALLKPYFSLLVTKAIGAVLYSKATELPSADH